MKRIVAAFMIAGVTLAGHAVTNFCDSADTLVNTLDPAPSNVLVLVNNGAAITRSAAVVLSNRTFGATWTDVSVNPAFSPCVTQAYAAAFPWSLLQEGTNTIWLRYRDVLGGFCTTSVWIILDTIVPTAPLLVSPANSSCWGSTSVPLEWVLGSDANGSGGAQLATNAGLIAVGLTNTFNCSVAQAVAINWRVRNWDAAANTSAWSDLWQFTVDTNVPVVTLVAPSHGLVTNGLPLLAWTVSGIAPVASNVVSVAGFMHNVGSATSLLASVSEGTHQWLVTSFNTLGRSGASGMRSFTYDATPPVVTSAGGLASNVFVCGVNTVRVDVVDAVSGVDWSALPGVRLTVGAWPAVRVYQIGHSATQWFGQVYLPHYYGDGLSSVSVSGLRDMAKNIAPAVTMSNVLTRSVANGERGTPAGSFIMGSTENADEQPLHSVYLDEFSVDRYEVANEAFAQFVDAGGYGNSSVWNAAGWAWRSANGISVPVRWNTNAVPMWSADSYSDKPNSPVLGISWYEAEAFASWAGRRLPTEAEWEYAARQPNNRAYPWGNDFWLGQSPPTYALANWQLGYGGYSEAGYTSDGAVNAAVEGSYGAGAAVNGALDMLGNAREWVADWYADPYETNVTVNPPGPNSGTMKVLRGGSFLTGRTETRSADRHALAPTTRGWDTGFRTATAIPEPAVALLSILLCLGAWREV